MAMLNIQKVKSILNWWLNHYTMVIQTIKHGGRCTFSWFMHWESCSIQEWRENLILLDELPFMVFEMFFPPGEIIHNFHGVIQQSIVQRGQHHLFSQQMTAGKRPKSQVLVDLSGWAHEKTLWNCLVLWNMALLFSHFRWDDDPIWLSLHHFSGGWLNYQGSD